MSRVAARRRVTSYSALASRSRPSVAAKRRALRMASAAWPDQGVEQLALLGAEVQGP